MKNFKVIMINTYNIVPNCNKVRKEINKDKLASLVESIKNCGVIQPLVVRKISKVKSVYINGEIINSPKYEIISGERRWRSAKILNIKKLPCIIVKTNNEGSALLALIDNLQRDDLTLLEQANLYFNIMERFCLDIDSLADMLCVSQSFIRSKLNLLKLSHEEQTLLTTYKLSEDHLRELIRIDDEIKRKEILTKIAVSGLNIYETEELIDDYLMTTPTEEAKNDDLKKKILKISDIRFFYNSLEKALMILKQTGVSIDEKKVEGDDFVDIFIRINKHQKVNSD